MATRIYLPQTGAAPITPAFGTWTETTGADRIAGVATRIGSAMTSKTQAHTATAANSTFLSRQYVFGPLAAQTIPVSTIKGTIRVLESAANDNLDAMRLLVRVVSGDGATYRTPVLYGPTNGTVAEFNTALRAKRLATGGATASVVVSAGDYLVIEIGTTNTTVGTSLSDSISYGDNSATDLGDNETDTAANNPFVEIAATITLLALSGSDSGAGSDTSSAPAVALTSIDSGAGVETSAVTSVTSVSTDGGIGTDSPAVLGAATDVRPDGGTGTDASAGIMLGTRTDAGGGADAPATVAAVLPTRADAGAAADTATHHARCRPNRLGCRHGRGGRRLGTGQRTRHRDRDRHRGPCGSARRVGRRTRDRVEHPRDGRDPDRRHRSWRRIRRSGDRGPVCRRRHGRGR